MARPGGQKLLSLELGRFFAAASVLLFHIGITVTTQYGLDPLDHAFVWGHAGVEYFFVLSGFIILYVHRPDLGRPARLGGFAYKRLARIFPMLWIVLLTIGLIRFIRPNAIHSWVSNAAYVKDLFLIPHRGRLTLSPAWTLQREMLFYAVFAGLIVSRRWGLAVLAVWQVGILAMFGAVLAGWHPPDIAVLLFDRHNLGFMLGMLACWCVLEIEFPRGVAIAATIVGVLGFAATAVLERSWQGNGVDLSTFDPIFDEIVPVAYSLFAAKLIFGLARLEQLGALRLPRWAGTAGAISYAIYLLHEPISSLLLRLLPAGAWRMSAALCEIGVAIVVLVVAFIVHVTLERPLMRRLSLSRVRPPALIRL